MSKFYLHGRCYEEIDNAIDSLRQFKIIFKKYISTLNLGDYEILAVNLPNKEDKNYEIKNYIYFLAEKIDELNSYLDDALDEVGQLEDDIENLEDNISELENMISLSDYQVDNPSTYIESELLEIVLSVYKNKDRLSEADKSILKVLSQKTL